MHLTYSDGNLTSTELVRCAKKRKVDIIALTDHNNCDGLDEAINEAKRIGIVVIPAVELSTKYKEDRVHILGYFKDDSYKNELLKEVLKKVKQNKIDDLRSIFGSKINFNGYKKKLYVESGIELLRFFGASVVLAHPVLLSKEYFFNIANMGFDGIEARYFLNTEKYTKFYIGFAKEKGLLYSWFRFSY
ncbi:MAG: PHP domain-containing protein [Clostridium sp.]|nr:PHP domain-containing protein [Clostridium sp.]